jgi:predicted secreted protein
MASSAKSGKGTTLTRAGNLIAEITKIGGPKLSRDTIDVTNHDSVNDYKEKIAGIKDGGDVSIEGNFIPGDSNGQIGLLTDFEAGTLQTFVLTLPTAMATTWTFTAIVKNIESEAPFDDKVPFKATLAISGKPVLGVTASAGFTTPFLTASVGTFIPAVAQATLSYVLNVVTGTTSITLTPTAAAGVIVVTANGVSQTVNSGAASTAITLGAAGSITVVTITVTETNKQPKTYTVNVARA